MEKSNIISKSPVMNISINIYFASLSENLVLQSRAFAFGRFGKT